MAHARFLGDPRTFLKVLRNDPHGFVKIVKRVRLKSLSRTDLKFNGGSATRVNQTNEIEFEDQ